MVDNLLIIANACNSGDPSQCTKFQQSGDTALGAAVIIIVIVIVYHILKK